MQLSPGDKIGPYEILERSGRGGMGEVWKARDTRLDRIVAIKTSNQQFSERFEREARAVAALNHPNICTLHDVGPNYLVMEFVEGAPLKGPLPLDEVLRIAHQLTAALEAAHEKHITHRDLKPGNILLKPDGNIKVLDFGLAKMAAPARTDLPVDESPTLTMGMTEAGMILGTAAYMAPEQAKGKDVDKRADIWAFGVVVYELVTGSRPFHGADMAEVLASVIKEQPSYEPVPYELRRLLKKCLEKDPAKRLRDIGDVWELLQEPPLDGGAPAPQRASSPPSKLPWAVAAGLAAGLAGLAYFALPHFREEPPKVTKFEFAPPENGMLRTNGGPPAVSPDGRHVAFRAFVDGRNMLWVRDLDSLNARMLPGTEDPVTPFWAPDSRQVAFRSGDKLMKIDLTGGPATTITAASSAYGGTWNQDDVIVFGTPSGLLRVAAAGGTPTPVTEIDKSRNEIFHAHPQFLPDGRHFLYQARSSDAEKSTVLVGDLESPNKNADKKLILQSRNNARYVEPSGGARGESGYLLFVRENTLMAQPFDAGKLATTGDPVPVAENVLADSGYGYFGSSRNGTLAYATGGSGTNLQITWYDRSGKVVGTVGKPADIQTPRLSPNGKMVAVDRLDPQSSKRDIWLHDLARGTEQRLTFAESNTYPVWSPDSLRVAYSRGGKVMVKSADGTGQEEVLETTGPLPQDWTRDGGFLISAQGNSNPKTGNDLWALPLSAGKAPRGKESGKPVPLRETEFGEWHGRVSPDGRWLAYMSNESKRYEVYVVGFPSLNGKWQVSVNGGVFPVWSRDGRELYFMGLDSKLMAAAIAPGAFQAGVPQPLFDARMGTSGNRSFDVSADGRFLIASPVDQAATVPMTVVLNWQAGLKR